jgi:hypothetical protein
VVSDFVTFLQRQWERAERIRSHWEICENRLAFARLFLVGVGLFWYFRYFSNWSWDIRGGVAFGMILVFVWSLRWQQRMNHQKNSWLAYQISLKQRISRRQRHWKEMDEDLPRWHRPAWDFEVQSLSPSGHSYLNDLGIGQELYPLLNTCCTKLGSQKLVNELLTRGKEPIDDLQRSQRLKGISLFLTHTSWLRKLQIFRWHQAQSLSVEETSLSHLQRPQVGEVSPLPSQGPFRKKGSLIFLGVHTTAWLGLWIWMAILWEANSLRMETVSRAFLVYLPFCLVAAALLKSQESMLQNFSVKVNRTLGFLDALHSKKEIHPLRSVKWEQGDLDILDPAVKSDLRQLKRWVVAGEVRRNPVVWVILQILLPFDSLLHWMILKKGSLWDSKWGSWESQVAHLDFLACLARMAKEDPGFKETAVSSQSEAWGMWEASHPCLPLEKRVSNALILEPPHQLVLLTGSNMAGKSTFLRTLGCNLLLINMGSRAPASRISHRHLQIHCAIKVEDSLVDGTSYFYAEVKRIASILKSIGKGESGTEPQFLVLIDEIFKGTNNKERLLGARSVIDALMGSHAISLVTTHDLSLAQMEESSPRLVNMHFREKVDPEGGLRFEYLLHPGACPTTNALVIMRQAGLPVPEV